MMSEQNARESRAQIFAALGEPARLAIVDLLADNDATASEVGAYLQMPSNLLAHHLGILQEAGLVTRRRSEGDRRRWYLHLQPHALIHARPATLDRAGAADPTRLLFVCTANSARSHLAAALWRRASALPAASAGTHPARRINPNTLKAARRARLTLPRVMPQRVDEVHGSGDLVVTVCDRAHEDLPDLGVLHWSVPDPVPGEDAGAFDRVVVDLAERVAHLASALAVPPHR